MVYLTAPAIDATLGTVSGCGPGSEIVLSYDASDAFLDDAAREMVKIEGRLVAATGEPYTTRMAPAEAEALVEGAGLEVVEHLTPEALQERFFPGATTGCAPRRPNASSPPERTGRPRYGKFLSEANGDAR